MHTWQTKDPFIQMPQMTWCSIDNHTDNCEKLMSFPLSDHNHQADFFVTMVHAGYVCVSIIHWSLTWTTWMCDRIMLDFACWQWAISLGSKFCADSTPHKSSLEETINWGPCDQWQKTLTLHQLLIILAWLWQCDQMIEDTLHPSLIILTWLWVWPCDQMTED